MVYQIKLHVKEKRNFVNHRGRDSDEYAGYGFFKTKAGAEKMVKKMKKKNPFIARDEALDRGFSHGRISIVKSKIHSDGPAFRKKVAKKYSRAKKHGLKKHGSTTKKKSHAGSIYRANFGNRPSNYKGS